MKNPFAHGEGELFKVVADDIFEEPRSHTGYGLVELATCDGGRPTNDGALRAQAALMGRALQHKQKVARPRSELQQLELFVSDEASATKWIRQQLQGKPQTFQELQPQFMQQIQSWAKHEITIELKEILALNFLCYEGDGNVPSQIHNYLSTNFRELRNLEKDDERLKSKANDRWYVADAKKESDLEKLRMRTLLREFEEYRTGSQRKIKEFRSEAVRAGFKRCYDAQDYETIVTVAAKLPEQVIQEDEKLLMYYDVATMRLGDSD